MPEPGRARVFVIAEAGVNHNGSVSRALEMVDAAALAGADAVKFQTFRADLLTTRDAVKAEYQAAATGGDETQYAMLKRLELSEADHRSIAARCMERDIEFMSAAFDGASLSMLVDLGIRRVKVPSGELVDTPLLRRIAGLGLPVLLSTGMADLGEVEVALTILERAGCPRDAVTVLHCTTEYPTPSEDVNLMAMVTMRQALGVKVGYSDHTLGFAAPIAAVALGAEVIEKHMTLDRSLPGPDHAASLEPAQFAQMVESIRSVEVALGDGVKAPRDDERANANAARKSIVAARFIRQGELITEDALTAKRPGTGMSPLLWDAVVGRRASRSYEVDEQIAEVIE